MKEIFGKAKNICEVRLLMAKKIQTSFQSL